MLNKNQRLRLPAGPKAGGKAEVRLRKIGLLVQACNLYCPMCSMNLNIPEAGEVLRDYPGATKGPQLTLEEYKAFFQSLAPDRPSVSIGGGEPMIFPYMVDLIEYLTGELGLNVGMTSNGTLFDEEKLQRFARTGAGITISVDGLEETHEAIRGEGNFALTIDTLRRLVDLKQSGAGRGPVSSLFCVHQPNYLEAPGVARLLLDDVGVETLTMSFLIFSTDQTLENHRQWSRDKGLPPEFDISIRRGGGGVKTFDDLASMDFDELWEIKCELDARYSRLSFEPDFETKDDLKTYFLTDDVMPGYFSSACRVVRTEIFLISNGDLMFAPQCFQLKCGNVRDTTFEDVWNGPIYGRLRSALAEDLSPVCAHCCANRVEKDQNALSPTDSVNEPLGSGTD